MSKKQDPISELNEWQEHQYNPGYWINRPPFFPPKRTKGWWIVSLIQAIIIVPSFLLLAWVYFFEGQDKSLLIPLIFLGLISIPAVLSIWALKPLKPFKTPQTEIEEINRKEKKERKKKLPKRRKDYQ